MRLRNIGISSGLAAGISFFAWASEEAPDYHKKWMKDAGEYMGKLRKGVDVEQSATSMAEVMKQTQGFWAKRTSDVAVKSCEDAVSESMKIVTAARAGDKAGISAGMKGVGAACKSCHEMHREKVSETEYRIK